MHDLWLLAFPAKRSSTYFAPGSKQRNQITVSSPPCTKSFQLLRWHLRRQRKIYIQCNIILMNLHVISHERWPLAAPFSVFWAVILSKWCPVVCTVALAHAVDTKTGLFKEWIYELIMMRQGDIRVTAVLTSFSSWSLCGRGPFKDDNRGRKQHTVILYLWPPS